MNRTMNSLLICVALISLSGVALADATFVIADPPVACGVIDMVPFDGNGDSGPYDFDTVILGTTGEKRAMAEFDLSTITIPAGEVIESATYEVQIYSNYVGGLGCPYGQVPDTMAVDGYVGNGVEELSDFQAGTGNFLARVDSSEVVYLSVLSFDVSEFVAGLIANGDQYAGLTLRAEQVGGVSVWDGIAGYPKLTITTTVPEPTSLALLALGAMGFIRRR